jgi:hypothetical protein
MGALPGFPHLSIWPRALLGASPAQDVRPEILCVLGNLSQHTYTPQLCSSNLRRIFVDADPKPRNIRKSDQLTTYSSWTVERPIVKDVLRYQTDNLTPSQQ